MKACEKCDRDKIDDNVNYCPSCGSRDLVAQSGPKNEILLSPQEFVDSSLGKRTLAFLIDTIIAGLISTMVAIPGLNIIAAIAGFLYQLLRDLKGASVGKIILGLRVVSDSGGNPTSQQLMTRNLLFAIPFLGGLIPIVGLLLTYGGELILYLIEVILVISTKKRMGDRFGGTRVVANS